MREIFFNKYFKSLNLLSIIFIVVSIIFLFFKGLNFGVDFKGGTLMELRVSDKNISITNIRDSFNNMNLNGVKVKEFGNSTDFIVMFQSEAINSPELIKDIKDNIKKKYGMSIDFRRVESVGPKVSSELLKSGIIAITLSLVAMLVYIWIRFEWQFSLGAILALFHDVIVTLGIFSLFSLEINLSIIAAVLTIVGYSMNDTVVIYDRIRENLSKFNRLEIDQVSNLSVNETLSRTLITSVTTLLALFSIFILGGEILKGFSFAMILGVIFGTYSSIYIANPLLVKLNVSQKTIIKEED